MRMIRKSGYRFSERSCAKQQVRQPAGEGATTMSKPVKTEAELIAMARAELKVHADCPDGIAISIIRDGDSWEFRAKADKETELRERFALGGDPKALGGYHRRRRLMP